MRSQQEERAQGLKALQPVIEMKLLSIPLVPVNAGNALFGWTPADPADLQVLVEHRSNGWVIESTVAMQKSSFGSTLIYTLTRATTPTPERQTGGIKCR